MFPEFPVKVITGIVPVVHPVGVFAVAVPAVGAGLTVTVTPGPAEVTVAQGLVVILTKYVLVAGL